MKRNFVLLATLVFNVAVAAPKVDFVGSVYPAQLLRSWTLVKNELPTGRCSPDELPAVLGTTDSHVGGAVGQYNLDGRRCEALMQDVPQWDGSCFYVTATPTESGPRHRDAGLVGCVKKAQKVVTITTPAKDAGPIVREDTAKYKPVPLQATTAPIPAAFELPVALHTRISGGLTNGHLGFGIGRTFGQFNLAATFFHVGGGFGEIRTDSAVPVPLLTLDGVKQGDRWLWGASASALRPVSGRVVDGPNGGRLAFVLGAHWHAGLFDFALRGELGGLLAVGEKNARAWGDTRLGEGAMAVAPDGQIVFRAAFGRRD